jgi:hypothetical protein
MLSVGVAAWLYQRYEIATLQASTPAPPSSPASSVSDAELPPEPKAPPPVTRPPLPASARLTILAGSFALSPGTEGEIRSLTEWLESSGYAVYFASIDHGRDGQWQRVLAGTYTDAKRAAADAARLKKAAPELEARVLTFKAATGNDR